MKHLLFLTVALTLTLNTIAQKEKETADFAIIATPSNGGDVWNLFLQVNNPNFTFNQTDVSWKYMSDNDLLTGKKWSTYNSSQGKTHLEYKQVSYPWPIDKVGYMEIYVKIGDKRSKVFVPEHEDYKVNPNAIIDYNIKTICWNNNGVTLEMVDNPHSNYTDPVYSGKYMWVYSTDGKRTFKVWPNSQKKINTGKLTSTTHFYAFAKGRAMTSNPTENIWFPNGRITITMNGTELQSGTINSNQNICNGTRPSQLNGTPPTGGNGQYHFQWQKKTNGSNWNDISEARGANYQPEVLTQTTNFRRIDKDDCGLKETNPITITVYERLDIGILGSDQDICYNTQPDKLIGPIPTGGDGTYSFEWLTSTNGTSWSKVYNERSSNYQPSELKQTTIFKRIVKSNCETIESNPITITVYPEFHSGIVSNNQNICSNTQPKNIFGTTPSGGKGVYTYQWKKSLNGINWSDIIGATDANYQPEVLTQTTHFKRKDNGGCDSKETNSVIITVYDSVDVDIQINAQNHISIANGERISIMPNIISNLASENVSYTWIFDHQQEGWYETMFSESPSQYFHWKGWYNITLLIETPTGCRYKDVLLSAFYVNEETEDVRHKTAFTGSKKALDSHFGKNAERSIKVYPSAFDYLLTIEIKNSEESVQFQLFDLTGRALNTKTVGDGIQTILTSDLHKGVYVVKITSSDGTLIHTQKVLKK